MRRDWVVPGYWGLECSQAQRMNELHLRDVLQVVARLPGTGARYIPSTLSLQGCSGDDRCPELSTWRHLWQQLPLLPGQLFPPSSEQRPSLTLWSTYSSSSATWHQSTRSQPSSWGSSKAELSPFLWRAKGCPPLCHLWLSTQVFPKGSSKLSPQIPTSPELMAISCQRDCSSLVLVRWMRCNWPF